MAAAQAANNLAGDGYRQVVNLRTGCHPGLVDRVTEQRDAIMAHKPGDGAPVVQVEVLYQAPQRSADVGGRCEHKTGDAQRRRHGALSKQEAELVASGGCHATRQQVTRSGEVDFRVGIGGLRNAEACSAEHRLRVVALILKQCRQIKHRSHPHKAAGWAVKRIPAGSGGCGFLGQAGDPRVRV